MDLNVRTSLTTAVKLLQAGNIGQAQAQCQHILSAYPNHPETLHLLGLIQLQSGNHQGAVDLIRRSITITPQNFAAHNNLGLALRRLGKLQEALRSYDTAIQIKQDYAEAYNNRGSALLDLGRPDHALADFERALALTKPHLPAALQGRANALVRLGRHDEALAAFKEAIDARPRQADIYNELANLLVKLGRRADALRSYSAAIALGPNLFEAYNNRGNVFLDLNRVDEALADYDRAISGNPGFDDAHNGRGEALLKAKRYPEAIRSFESLISANPDYPFALGNLLHSRMLCCDWSNFSAVCDAIERGLASKSKVVEPFGYQGISESESDLMACATIYAESEFPSVETLPKSSSALADSKVITIGYLCGEFREQATSILACGMFECHDRSCFRLIALDNGWDDGSEYRKRIGAAFDSLIEIAELSDDAVANLIRENRIDILVNLNGYFGRARQSVFARRPSPIQVNYLGFPGTIGASYIDYLIADATVIPESSRGFYSEKIAYLPVSYQVNDSKRAISKRHTDRAEFDLPAEAFVYSCFNNEYKITPNTFDLWMRILARVDKSVLWLIEDNRAATQNLRREARRRGVSEDRLVFAKRLPPDEHLARHRHADLFLDTLPYNAHTTASDALWAGLPVLTIMGTTFPGRVAASLLYAIDMPELVCEDSSHFEALAVEFASNPGKLKDIREKLGQNRICKALFDTRRTTRHVESAYLAMVDRHLKGLPPDHIFIVE